MNCAQVKEQLVDYLYGEMSAPARSAFDEHLRGCPGCNAEVAGHAQVLGHARAALSGPLLQEPPARVRLAVMDAAKTQARALRHAESQDRPGFIARLLRTPWVLPAFGAASVATVVFLVRVLKNPEIIPHRVPATLMEESEPAAEPLAPTPPAGPATPPSAKSAAEPGSRAMQPIPPHEAATARRHARAAASNRGAPEPARKRRAASRELPADLLRGAGTARDQRATGFAEPPPQWGADRKADRSTDDLMGSVKPDRSAPPPPATTRARSAAVRNEERVHGRPPVAAKSMAEKKHAEVPPRPASPIPSLAAPQPAAAPSAAASPPPALTSPAPSYAAPPKPLGSADMDMAESEAAAWEPADKELVKAKAPMGNQDARPSLEESVRKADRLFANRDWTAAATAYRDLLNRFPDHKHAARWRARMNQSLVAEEQARTPRDAKASKAAKAKSVDVLNGEMK